LASIPLTDVLFLQQHGEDVVIANAATMTFKDGAHLHSQPPADYGQLDVSAEALGFDAKTLLSAQPDGWQVIIIENYKLPDGYVPSSVRLLVKLPPLFPEAQPDMFWIAPHVQAPSGQAPAGVSSEVLLGETWQRFSWHLKPGAWLPGVSTLRDYMRCIRARFERGN